MSDGAINIEPSAEILAGISISCCDTFRTLSGKEPLCGFLSYSTDGSGNSPSVFRVREAIQMAQQQRPDLKIDGEFQADAAIVQRVAAKKVKRERCGGKSECTGIPGRGSLQYRDKADSAVCTGTQLWPDELDVEIEIQEASLLNTLADFANRVREKLG